MLITAAAQPALSQLHLPSVEEEARLVQAAFAQRRKTLRNSLRALLTVRQIEAAGVDPGERAEQLNLSQFAALSRALSYDSKQAK